MIISSVSTKNIFSICDSTSAIVIPTNIGWNSNGHAIMGAGLAKQLMELDPTIVVPYGQHCLENRNVDNLDFPLMIIPHYENKLGTTIVLMPTKELDRSNPSLSWKNNASLELIKAGLDKLVMQEWSVYGIEKIYVPLFGCGNGNLSFDDVLPIMLRRLDNRFHLIDRAYKP